MNFYLGDHDVSAIACILTRASDPNDGKHGIARQGSVSIMRWALHAGGAAHVTWALAEMGPRRSSMDPYREAP